MNHVKALVFSVVTVIFLCLSCDSGTKQVDAERLATCEKRMGVTFPSTTEALYYKMDVGLDDSIKLAVRMPPADVSSFLQNSPFADIELRDDRKYVPLDGPADCWNVRAVENYESGQASLPNGEALNILIDRDDDEKVTVYLFWHET